MDDRHTEELLRTALTITQVSDLAFRRHVLVQALILTDFLLSLTARAKKKLEDKTNKSVLYSYTLSEADVRSSCIQQSYAAPLCMLTAFRR